MKKSILAIAISAAMVASSASLATGTGENVSTGSVSASASIPYNGQGTAVGQSTLTLGSYSNTGADTYTGYKGLHAEADGNTISWFDGQANAYVTGGVGPAAEAHFSGTTRVDASRYVEDSTWFRGDYSFDYEAVSAKVELGSNISGAGDAYARNVNGPYTSERIVRVVGDATSDADVYGRTIGNRETKTNVILNDYARGDVIETAIGTNGVGEYAAGRVDVDAYARGEGRARD